MQKHQFSLKSTSKQEIFVKEKEREINEIYTKGRRLFKAKKYEQALPYYHDALKKFEELYSENPEHFKSRSNRIMAIHSELAKYYRWKERQPKKAIGQYKAILRTMDKLNIDEARRFYIRIFSKIKRDKTYAEYEIVRIEDGDNISYGIYFINIFGEWKIEKF